MTTGQLQSNMNELAKKRSLLRELLDRHALDAILLQRVSSIAWMTEEPPHMLIPHAATRRHPWLS